jgi:transketolase
MRKKCLETIYDLAKKNKKIVFIGSDLGPNVLDEFKKKFPNRFFMEGVSEQSIVGIAAGMAMEKNIPFVNTISTFITRRCYEQIVIDLCLHNLPVKLVGNGGGLVYAPLGPTHQAIEDLSIMRVIPNMSIIAPCDEVEMEMLVRDSVKLKSPLYIRIARGGEEIISSKKENFKIGKAIIKKKPGKILFISTGVMTQKTLKAAKEIEKKGLKCGVLHMATIKPLDKKTLSFWIPKVEKIITVEENILAGGFGSSILEFTSENFSNHVNKISRMGLPNKFVNKYGSQDELCEDNGLTVKNIYNFAKKTLKL